MEPVVGTAYVLIRAITRGLRQDIRRGVEQGSRRSEREVRREGRRLGEQFGEEMGEGLGRSPWARIVSRSVRASVRSVTREMDAFHRQALDAERRFERERTQALRDGFRERARLRDREHAEAIRINERIDRHRERLLSETLRRQLEDVRRQQAEKERLAVREIEDTIRVARAYEDQSRRVRRAVTRATNERRRDLRAGVRDVQQSIERIVAERGRFETQVRDFGRRIGRRIGQEIALEIRRLPILPFVIAGLAPVLAGVAKIIAAFVGEAVSLLSRLGPALSASLATAGVLLTSFAQGVTALTAALVTEGDRLDAFTDRMDGVRDRLREVGHAIQEVTLDPLADDIDRVVDALLPRLRSELVQTGRVIVDTSGLFAGLSEDPFFQARFGTILSANNEVLANVGHTLVNLADSLATVGAAASPLAEQFAAYVAEVTAGWSESLRLAQATGELSDWFRRAGETMQQLGRITSNTRRALSETLQIANRSSNDLLDRIEELTRRWLRFTRSAEGRNRIADFLDGAREVAMEVNALFGEMFRMVGRGLASNNEGLINFIRTIRLRMLPAISSMASAFAGMAPLLSQLVVTTANFFQALAETGVLSAFLTTMTSIFQVIEGLLSLPVVGQITAWSLAFLALGRALNIVTLGAFTRALRPMAGRLGQVTTALGLMGGAAVQAAGGAGVGALRSSMGLLLRTLGGPIGIAIAGVVTALGFLANAHLNAKREAEEHEAQMLELAGTLDRANGAITDQTREWVANQLEAEGYDEVLRRIGVDTRTATEAALGNAQAMEQVRDAIDNSRVERANELFGEQADRFDNAGISQREFAEALLEGGDAIDRIMNRLQPGQGDPILGSWPEEVEEASNRHRDLAGFLDEVNAELEAEQERLAGVAEAAGLTSAEVSSLAEAIEILGDEFAGADEKARALDEAIRILEGGSRDVDRANRQMHETFRNVEDAFVDTAASAEAGETVYLDLASAIDESTGKLDQTTEVGARVGETFDRMFRAAQESALAIAENGGSAEEVREPFDQMNAQFRELLENAGATPGQIDSIMESLQGMPTEAIVDLILNSGQFDDAVAGAETKLAEMDATEAIAELLGDDEDLAYKIIKNSGDLDELDSIIATATADLDDDKAQEVYDEILLILADLDSQNPTPNADLQAAALEAKKRDIDRQLDELHSREPTPQVNAAIDQLLRKKSQVDQQLDDLDQTKVEPEVGVNSGPSLSAIRRINEGLASIRGKTVTVTTRHVGQNVPVAEGGILGPKGRLIAAANGMVARQREAMIAAGGTNILWAEPETHNESYIPWAHSKRPRATRILDRTAREFGYNLTPMAEGGLVTRVDTALSRDSAVTPDRRGTAETGVTNLHVTVDGPEVERRAREIAREMIREIRREEAVAGRFFGG